MREKIKLESTAGTGHFYTTTKNKKTMPEVSIGLSIIVLMYRKIHSIDVNILNRLKN